MSLALAWALARLRRTGGALVAGFLIAVTVVMSLARIKHKSERKGRRIERKENQCIQLRQALKDGEKHAKITDAMHEANVDGPHSRGDVLERMRNAEDD